MVLVLRVSVSDGVFFVVVVWCLRNGVGVLFVQRLNAGTTGKMKVGAARQVQVGVPSLSVGLVDAQSRL